MTDAELHTLAARILAGLAAEDSHSEGLARMGLTPFGFQSEPLDRQRLGGLYLAQGYLTEAAELAPQFGEVCVRLQTEGRVDFRAPNAAEGSFHWALSCLSSIAVIADWVDRAPVAFEHEVSSKLTLLENWLKRLESRTLPVLTPWLALEQARLLSFQGRANEALMELHSLLLHPLTTRQPGLIQRVRELLNTLHQPTYDVSNLLQPYQPATVAEWERVIQTITGIPKLLEAPQLPQACIELLTKILEPHQAFWLSSQGDDWEVLAYHGPPGFANFSRAFVNRAVSQGGLVQDPVMSDPTESLVLSEARSVLIELVEVGPRVSGVLYISHRRLEGRFRKGEREILTFVAKVIGSHLSAEQVHRERIRADEAVLAERQKLIQVYSKTSLGLSWLAANGEVLDWNSAFADLHPNVSKNLPFWHLMDRDEQLRAQRFTRQSGTEIFRNQKPGGEWDWHAYQLEVLQGGTRLCTTRQLSGEKLEGLVYFLEQEKHWQAADLHDGPCQVAGALSLANNQQSSVELQEILDTMEWLRSPLYSGQTPERAYTRLGQTLLPEVEWSVICSDVTWTPAQISLYRILQDYLEYLTDHATPSSLKLHVSGQTAKLEGVSLPYAGDASTKARLALHSGRIEHQDQCVKVSLR